METISMFLGAGYCNYKYCIRRLIRKFILVIQEVKKNNLVAYYHYFYIIMFR